MRFVSVFSPSVNEEGGDDDDDVDVDGEGGVFDEVLAFSSDSFGGGC